jgi:flagellar basal body rod protein FlgC
MEMKVASFKTRTAAMERIKEMQPWSSMQPDRVQDPEDPNANTKGYVWVISVSLHKDADKLYLCTDGNIR